jgi:hypothetical protein
MIVWSGTVASFVSGCSMAAVAAERFATVGSRCSKPAGCASPLRHRGCTPIGSRRCTGTSPVPAKFVLPKLTGSGEFLSYPPLLGSGYASAMALSLALEVSATSCRRDGVKVPASVPATIAGPRAPRTWLPGGAWWIGDWWAFGSGRKWGEGPALAEAAGVNYQTARTYGMVANEFQLFSRPNNLSFKLSGAQGASKRRCGLAIADRIQPYPKRPAT